MGIKQQYLGRFYQAALTMSLDDATNTPTITIPASYYYIAGHATELEDQLVEAITTAMQAETGFTTATCTYSASTGKVAFTFALSTTITFPAASAALKTAIGYDGTAVTGSSTYTGDNQAQHVWRPSLSPSAAPVKVKNFWSKGSTSLVGRSSDGKAYSITGNTYQDAEIRYDKLPEAEVPTPDAGTSYADLEQFFEDVIHKSPMRVYPDRALNTVSDYVTAIWGKPGNEPIGKFEDYATRHIAAWDGLWDVTIPLLEHTETATSTQSGAGEDMLIFSDFTTTTQPDATYSANGAVIATLAENFSRDSANPPIAWRVTAIIDSALGTSATLRLRVGSTGSQDTLELTSTGGANEFVSGQVTVLDANEPVDSLLDIDLYLKRTGGSGNVTCQGVQVFAVFDV